MKSYFGCKNFLRNCVTVHGLISCRLHSTERKYHTSLASIFHFENEKKTH